jgi:hypothetical protein
LHPRFNLAYVFTTPTTNDLAYASVRNNCICRNPTQHLVLAFSPRFTKSLHKFGFSSRKLFYRRHADCIACCLAVSYQDKPHFQPVGQSLWRL